MAKKQILKAEKVKIFVMQEAKHLLKMLPVVTWEENHVSIKPVDLGGKDGKLNVGNVLLAVN